eukprot:171219-Hanusia_phi.AAC.1
MGQVDLQSPAIVTSVLIDWVAFFATTPRPAIDCRRQAASCAPYSLSGRMSRHVTRPGPSWRRADRACRKSG